MDKWTIADAAWIVAIGLVTLMLRLCGRNPGVIGPEIDSPFFDVNVASVQPCGFPAHEGEEI